MSSLPEDVALHAPVLTQLKLAHNALASLPGWLAGCGQLGTLVLDHNGPALGQGGSDSA